MNTKIPESWVEVKISDVAKIASGGTPSTSNASYFDGDIPWITPVDLSGYKKKYINKGRRTLSESGLKNSSAKLLPQNTVLFSSRAPIGYVAIAQNSLATNQGFKNLLPNEFYNPSYAYYYLKFIKNYAESQASGTTFKELSGSKMGELPFILAPLAEQKRIADKLDNLFHHLDTLNERLDRIPVLLKRFRENVLREAIEGKLTAEWRIINDYPNHWANFLLADICEINPGHKGIEIADYLDVSFIPMTNIMEEKGEIALSDIRKYLDVKKGYTKFIEGDVLFAKITPCMENGKIAIAKGLTNKIGCGTTEVHVFRCKEKILNEFLFYFLVRKEFRDYCELSFQGTSGHQRVPTSLFKELNIGLPSVEEQKEIIIRVNQLLDIYNQIEVYAQSLKEKFSNLPHNLLSKAFRGELVPQDPDDELASILLDKITQLKTR